MTGCLNTSSRARCRRQAFCFFTKGLYLENQWRVNGNHYYKTCEDWLKLDRNYKQAGPILERRVWQVAKDEVVRLLASFFLVLR